MERANEPNPFELNVAFKGRFRKALFGVMKPALERAFSLRSLARVYRKTRRMGKDRHFVHRALSALKVTYEVSDAELERVPKTGPAVVVANHPFGGVEGIILAAMLRTVRPDVRIMANFLLERIPELRDTMIFVDPFGGAKAMRANLKAMRACIAWVEGGGVLGVFPSGTVSHVDLRKRAVTDPPWSPTIARIIRKTGAPVVPVYFHGQNSALFQVLGMIHPGVRTALLPRELANKRRTTITMRVGSLIPAKKVQSFKDDGDLMDYLRLRTYIMRSRPGKGEKTSSVTISAGAGNGAAAVIDAVDPAALVDEIAGLPKEAVLIDSHSVQIILASAGKIPQTLREIGRLREITFREANEGTGKELDLDRFDGHYLHLFAWNKEKGEVIGGYRLGLTDEVLATRGLDGLYTSTLFRYERRLLDQIGPAVEMGRSFIRVEYQRSFSALMLLWKGIGKFVVDRPRYRTLFGPVSINNQYQTVSRQLIMAFLKANNYLPDLAKLIRAKNPPRVEPLHLDLRPQSRVVRDVDEVSDLVSEVEADQKGVPILLTQYMKLGGKLLGFNVDPEFGDVLDGLILVDLTQTDRRILDHYMGREGREKFLEYHAAAGATGARG